jgi:hypothetical protein
MNEQGLFLGVVAVSIYNGLFSPITALVFLMAQYWMPVFIPLSLGTAQYGASLIISTTTLLLAGVPAALYERWRGLPATSSSSCLIWLIGAILLTIPAALRTVG